MRAGKPRGPTLVSICMHAFTIARVSRVRDKKPPPPALTFPISCRGGGVCACEASAGGRVSHLGKAVYPRCPRTERVEGRKCGDLVPLFYLGAPASAYRKAAPIP